MDLINLSSTQRYVWLEQLVSGNTASFNIGGYACIDGHIDTSLLTRAISMMIAENEIFSFRLVQEGNDFFQRLRSSESFPIVQLNFSDHTAPDARCIVWMQDDFQQPLDVANQEFIKFVILRSAGKVYWYIKSHHIILDGWAFALIFKKTGNLFSRLQAGNEEIIKAASYRLHVDDELKYLASPEYMADKMFWENEFARDRDRVFVKRVKQQKTPNFKHQVAISRASYDVLNSVAKTSGATLFHSFLAVFYVLLRKLHSKKDLVIGIPVLNRRNAVFKEMIGLFMGISSIRCELRDDMTISDLVRHVSAKLRTIYKHQRFQIADFLSDTGQQRLYHENVYDIKLSYEKYDYRSFFDSYNSTIHPLNHCNEEDPISIYIREYSATGEVIVDLVYNNEYMDEDTAVNFTERFEVLVNSFTAHSTKQLKDISLFREGEREQILNKFSVGPVRDIVSENVIEEIGNAATRYPTNIAVIAGDKAIEYRDLWRKINQIACLIRRSNQIAPGKRVGVLVSRDENVIVAIAGILRAGNTYVPLDENMPVGRLSFILQDASCEAVLTDKFNREKVGHVTGIPIISVEHHTSCDDDFHSEVSGEQLAYVIYTSGSTGTPKGVPITHRSLRDYVNTFSTYFDITAHDRVIQQASVCFDTSIEEIFPALVNGGTVVVSSTTNDFSLITNEIEQKRVTVLSTNPYYIEYLNNSDTSTLQLRAIINGGDTLQPRQIDRLIATSRIFNTYGPTESTVCATYFQVEHISSNIPIGQPITNREVYILDEFLNPVPSRVFGEMFIGGEGLSLSYLNQDEQTRERFIDHPFHTGKVLFRTGDRARFKINGDIEFSGRTDRQVKIAGFRIELDEIEHAVKLHDSIADCKVLVKNDAAHKMLVAYVVLHHESAFDEQQLKRSLGLSLPSYMIPARIVPMASFPLTPGGKIDVQNLPEPLKESAAQKHVDPRNDVEAKIAHMWQEILAIDRAGIYDNFFELGGNSLKANSFLARLSSAFRHDITLRSFFESPTINFVATCLGDAEVNQLPLLKPIPRDRDFPASYAQERLWFLQKVDKENRAYFVPRVIRVEGEFDFACAERALTLIIDRHEILRTAFVERDGKLYQKILQPYAFKAKFHDLSGLSVTQQDSERKRLIDSLSGKEFDIASGRLLRLDVLTVSEKEFLLLWCQHHLIHDGWTQGILIREFVNVYSQLKQGSEIRFSPLPIQYADYAYWQRNYMTGKVLQDHLRYWTEKLNGVNALMDLPLDRPRPAFFRGKGDMKELVLSAKEADELRAFSLQHKTTLFTTMLTVFKLLLYKVTGNNDLCIGGSFANRGLSEIEGMLGMVINNLPLRTIVHKGEHFLEFLHRVRNVCLDALQHEETPLDRIVEALKIERDLSHLPLFQVGFGFMDTPATQLALPGTNIIVENMHNGSAKFDLLMIVVTPKEQLNTQDADRGIIIELEFNTDIFDGTTIDWLLNSYQELLRQTIINPERALDSFSISQAFDKVIEDANATTQAYKNNAPVHVQIEQQCASTPHAIAVEQSGRTLSYAQVNRLANRLARRLVSEYNAGPGTTIGLLADNNVETIVAILAVLKTGAAYLPLDRKLPPERIRFILNDSVASIVLSDKEHSSLIDAGTFVDIDLPGNLQYADGNLEESVTSTDAAYILYTSGSTGTPKGVVVTHGNLLNYIDFASREYFMTTHHKRMASFTTLSFDLTVTSVFAPLVSGGTIILFPGNATEVINDVFYGDHRVDVVKLTPSHISLLGELDTKSTSIKLAIVGGEALGRHHIDILRRISSNIKIVNEYGPTECTVGCTYSIVHPEDPVITIGKPIGNTKVHILDDHLKHVPVRVKGELYIEGNSVAKGYLNKEVLTAEKFILNSHGRRLYRTGDIGRWLGDGNIELLGRKDSQVKIRGYRIELTEIEHALLRLDKISQAVVVPISNGDAPLLHAFLVGNVLQTEQLVGELEKSLPDYMIPSNFHFVASIPLTANGKVNADVLKAMVTQVPSHNDDAYHPSGKLEEDVLTVWKDTLGVGTLKANDNFFRSGGDSIKVIQVCSRLFEKGYKLDLHQLFSHPTLAQIIPYVELNDKVIDQREFTGPVEPSPIQRDFLNGDRRYAHHYNQSVMLQSKSAFSVDGLHAVVRKLQEHHDMLRLSVQYEKDQILVVEPSSAYPVSITSFDYTNEPGDALTKARRAAENMIGSFDLASDPMMRMMLFQIKNENYLFIVIHHLAVDGISWRILLEDMNTLYNQFLEGRQMKLPKKTHSFAFWSENQLCRHSFVSPDEEKYWLDVNKKFKAFIPVLYNDLQYKTGHRHTIETVFDEDSTLKLLAANAAYNTRIPDLLLAALGTTLHKLYGLKSLNLWMESHGREGNNDAVDVSRTVGWFTNIYPLSIDLGFADDRGRQLIEVKDVLKRVPQNGIGYSNLERWYGSKEEWFTGTGSHLLFNYLGEFDSDLKDKFFTIVNQQFVADVHDEWRVKYGLNIWALIVEQRLSIKLSFDTKAFVREQMDELILVFKEELLGIIDFCTSREKVEATPTDFSYKELSVDELNSIFD